MKKSVLCFYAYRKTTAPLFLLFFFSQAGYSQGSCASPNGPFFTASGLPSNYAAANGNGLCYNNLTAGQTYCWTYTHPSSGDFSLKVILQQTCGNCDGSSSICLSPGCSGSCTSVPTGCSSVHYNSSCATQQSGGIAMGTGCSPAEVCGTVFTWCITVPAGCGTMDVCPVVSGTFCGVLPVELLSFTGRNECSRNVLSWTTASEMQNDRFLVERGSVPSENPDDEIVWAAAGIVPGSGTTTTSRSYSFTDQPGGGSWYYRLTQVDADGRSETFTPVYLQENCSDKPSVAAYMNNGELLISASALMGPSEITLLDPSGRKVLSYPVHEDWFETRINTPALAHGLYILVIRSEKKLTTVKVALQ